MGSGEIGERTGFVIAEGVERNAGLGEGFGVLLQLDQLRATRWSPDGGSVEHDHGGAPGAVFVDVDHPIVVAGRGNGGELFADRRAGGEVAHRILARGQAGLGRAEGAVFVRVTLTV